MKVPAYASPARAIDYNNLPPTITFIGDMEPFMDETLEYINNLEEAGTPVTYKIFKGAFHGFEMIKPKAIISRDSVEFLLNAYVNYYDKYLTLSKKH